MALPRMPWEPFRLRCAFSDATFVLMTSDIILPSPRGPIGKVYRLGCKAALICRMALRRRSHSAASTCRKSPDSGGFDHDGGAVGQHFCDAGHDFVGVVAHADDGVRAPLGGVFHHQRVRIGPRTFAKLGIERDVAAEDRLQARADAADDATRAHDDAANHADAANEPVTRQVERGGDVSRIDRFHEMYLYLRSLTRTLI